MKILFVGDIVGSPGRKIVHDHLADILAQRGIDLCIANGENAASGFGITPRLADELFADGIEVMTGGNHIWDRKEILDYFAQQPRLIRPANFPDGAPGKGLYVGTAKNEVKYAVLDLQGRTFMTPIDDPFRVAERELAKVPADVKVIVVDMHAEATSEKQAMGWFLDGRVSAVLGTHTHVATADEHVLPGGTAFMCDVGMTGPYDSILGRRIDRVLSTTVTFVPSAFDVAEGDPRLAGAVVDVDPATGQAQAIRRIMLDEAGCAALQSPGPSAT